MTRVGNLQMGCGLLLFIIAALPLPLRAAPTAPVSPAGKPPASPVLQKSAPKTASPAFPAAQLGGKPAPSATAQSSQPAPASSQAQASLPAHASGPSDGRAAKGVVAPGGPLQLRLEPLKSIYDNREGVVMQFVFTALTKTKLCLDKDILSQMSVSMSRAGQGKLPLQPLVIHDNSQLFMQPMRVVWLSPGQKMTLRANLKRFRLDGGATWLPGEYSTEATFNLCEQTPEEPVTEPGREIPVKAVRPAWFMIME